MHASWVIWSMARHHSAPLLWPHDQRSSHGRVWAARNKPTIDNSLHMAAVWLQLAPAPLAAIAASILLLKLVLPAALMGPSRACTLSAAYLWFSVSSGAAVGQEMRQGLTRTRMTRFVQGKHEDMLVNALRLPRHTISSCFSSHSRRG